MSTNSETSAIDQAFEALKTYDAGSNRGALQPIDEAVVAAMKDEPSRATLETRLAAVLATEAPAVAKAYVGGKLRLIGGPASVPALAALLAQAELSHAARNALEALPCAEAIDALRASLAKLSGLPKAGVVASLGVRRDAASVPTLTTLLRDHDAQVAAAAIEALGEIGTMEAAEALRAFLPNASGALRSAAADACLTCAVGLQASGHEAEVKALRGLLTGAGLPEYVRTAAERGR